MKAIVVYESHWGSTAAVAHAIADGFGPEARALRTDEASGAAIEGADLIVAGAPVMAFSLPSEKTVDGLARDPGKGKPADVTHPPLRWWLEKLPRGHGRSAAFETRLWWSPGGATGAIERALSGAGYERLAKAAKFVVKGGQGPLRDGELDRARQWGVQLRQALDAELGVLVAAGATGPGERS
jgi:hypothetical protein